MVLTRDVRDEIESAVNQAVSKTLKSDLLISQMVQKVSEAVIKTIDDKFLKVETTMAQIDSKQNDLKIKLEEKIRQLENDVRSTNQEKQRLQEEIEKFDQLQRSENLRIFQLKEKSKEDTREEIKNLFKTHMSIKLSDNDIVLCYRVGKWEDGKTRGIFLKLSNNNIKQTIYGKKKLLKGTGIIIKEDLTALKVQLLNKAIEKVGVRNVWTSNGRIYIKDNNKVSQIRREQDIL